MNKAFDCFFYLLCVAGCLYQVYEISLIYFRYETATDVCFDVQGEQYLPGITICLPKQLFISESFKDNHQEPLTELNKLSVKEQFANLILAENISEVVDCDVLAVKNFNPNVSKDCNQGSRVTISINEKLFCLSLFMQNETYEDNFRLDTDSFIYNQGYLGHITIKNAINGLYLMIHNSLEKHIDYNKKSALFLIGPNTTLVTYEKVIYNFIENHGQKSCQKSSEYFSLAECMLLCKMNYYQARLGYLPSTKYMTANRSLDVHFKEDTYDNYLDEFSHDMITECNTQCGTLPYCHYEYYKPSYTTSKLQEVNNSKGIGIRHPIAPTLIFTQKAKIEWQEFLCYIASIVSLWFGVSLVMAKDWTKSFVIIAKNTYRKRIHNHVTINFNNCYNVIKCFHGPKLDN